MAWTNPRSVCMVAIAALLTGVGGCQPASRPHVQAAAVVQVTLEDFKIGIESHSTADRDITLHVVNHGPTMHEVNVVRTDLASDALPLGLDGMTVDDKSPKLEHVIEAEGLDINHQRNLALHLSPGHYVFYCNMEGHYLGHMFTSFQVTA